MSWDPRNHKEPEALRWTRQGAFCELKEQVAEGQACRRMPQKTQGFAQEFCVQSTSMYYKCNACLMQSGFTRSLLPGGGIEGRKQVQSL